MISIVDKFPQHAYMLNMEKSHVENLNYKKKLYIHVLIFTILDHVKLYSL